MIIKLLGSWLRGRGATVVLSLLFMAVSIYYGVCFELQARVDAGLRHLSERGVRLKLEQFNQTQAPPVQNAAPFYNAAIELCTYMSSYHVYDSLEATIRDTPDLADRLAERKSIEGLLDDGYRRPDCYLRFDMTQGLTMRSPNYLGLRSLCQWVGLRSLLESGQGHVQDAVDLETHAMCLLRRYKQSRMLIDAMVECSCGNILLDPLQALADKQVHANYSDLLRELDMEIDVIRPSLSQAVEVERAECLDLFDRHLTESVLDEYRSEESKHLVQMYRLGGHPLQLLDELRMLSLYERYDEALRNNTPDRLAIKPGDVPGYYLVSNCMVPDLSRAYASHSKYLTALQQVRSQLAALNTVH